MFAESLSDLQLAESRSIGYTYKCMGSGFWSLRQNDFRASLEAIAYEVTMIKEQIFFFFKGAMVRARDVVLSYLSVSQAGNFTPNFIPRRIS